ncbi:hypothetical protein FD754_003234 [Muntiacus muntjak]|uniref:Uncharacterized protein n=1 Tax=Muntiacus muntjak TaxID=9888 RepID=A0A5N3WE26_MUNMU|nr:hypothetical protein FD754_003234 [Muntiacus muntjak]
MSQIFKLGAISLRPLLNPLMHSGLSEFLEFKRSSLRLRDFTDNHYVSTLVVRCPNLVHLDLKFYQLSYLQHLSLSQFFGIMPDGTLQLLKETLPHLQINCSHFTTITRLTIGNQKHQEIRGIKC